MLKYSLKTQTFFTNWKKFSFPLFCHPYDIRFSSIIGKDIPGSDGNSSWLIKGELVSKLHKHVVRIFVLCTFWDLIRKACDTYRHFTCSCTCKSDYGTRKSINTAVRSVIAKEQNLIAELYAIWPKTGIANKSAWKGY